MNPLKLWFAAVLAGWLSASGCSTSPSLTGIAGADRISYVAVANHHGQPIARFEVDAADAPALKGWGRQAADICAEWYPQIAEILGVEDSLTNRTIRLYFRPMAGVANTDSRAGCINFSSRYVRQFPNDRGLVVHELAHTLQSFGGSTPLPPGNDGPGYVWLTEGIADYVRFEFYEPETRLPRINPATARYTDSYKVTATFLRWIAKAHDPDVVKKLNRALRDGNYSLDSFRAFTGKSIDELWAEFIAAWRARKMPW